MEIGKYNTLRVVKHVDFGVYLDGGEFGEILLPGMRDRMDAAIGTLVASAVKTGNRGKAQQAVAFAAEIPVPQERRADLQRQADAIAESIRVGDADSGESTVISSGWVTRQQYAAFARATGRPASLCRERAWPLRVFAP